MTLHFLNDVTNDAESSYVIITSLKSETMGKLINIIPGMVFWYQDNKAWL